MRQIYIFLKISNMQQCLPCMVSIQKIMFGKKCNFESFCFLLNEYDTGWYFLQNFQCTIMLIHAFCKICEHEIVFVLICSTGRTGRTISGSQLLQNTWIIKQTVIFLWKYWRKYGSVWYSFSCNQIFFISLVFLLLTYACV